MRRHTARSLGGRVLAVATTLLLGLGLGLVAASPAQAGNTVAIFGHVTLSGGGSAAGAGVTFLRKNDAGNWIETRNTTVNSDGSYGYTMMPTGVYTVRFGRPTGTDYAPEFWNNSYDLANAATINLSVDNTSASGIDAVLGLGGALTITAVEGAAQTPAQTVGVWLYSPLNTSTFMGYTGADGQLVLRGVMPNTYRVSLGKTGYEGECWNDWAACSRFDLVTITAGSAVQTLPVWMNTYPASFTFFSDVPGSSPFYTAIEWMASEGISTGTPVPYERPAYNPLGVVSRQAMALFLFRESGVSYVPSPSPSFADVPPSSGYYAAVQWMYSEGISTGSPNPAGGLPLYKPLDAVSRQAMAQFLIRASDVVFVPGATPHFADVPTTSSAYGAIEWMWYTGISTGTPQPSGLPLYKPLDPVSRQAMAQFLYRRDALP